VAKLRECPLVGTVDHAHREEHCLEVQVPFVQVAFPQARIVPILMGQVEARKVADLLLPLIDDKTLVVASSDLSHFHASDEAKKIDAESIATILKGDIDGFLDGCGEAPIRVLMHLAKAKGLKPVLLDAKNSFETAPNYGGAGRVVGYAAVAYVPSAQTTTAGVTQAVADTLDKDGLTTDTKKYLLKLARAALNACVRGEKAPSTADAPTATRTPSGCFVTLHKAGMLRGCIGNIEPEKDLCDAVVDNARNAALSDPRFAAVQPDELGQIDVEVSVLTVPQKLAFSSPEDMLAKLVPGRDGVILESGFHRSTFLPQVWEQLPDKVEFLEHLSRKGGMAADGWKRATVKTYRAEHFSE
jgi:AmmeMemoRadiSam system protein A